MNVLVIDVGGTHVKLLTSGAGEPRKFASGPTMTPDDLVARIHETVTGWTYDVVSLGYPGAVGPDGPTAEPGNLGTGWVGYDFAGAFGRPVRVVNDAAMQALGGYDGGRMLFLGLGTGLGSALVAERVIVPLELGSLPFGSSESVADRLGRDGLQRLGHTEWEASVRGVTETFCRAFRVDYLVLGGGNADRLDALPPCARRGGNDDAFIGGFRLWEERVEPHDQPPSRAWRVLQ